VGTAVAVQPQVWVRDQFGNDVPGATVTFSATADNGVLTGTSVVTDGAGLATIGSWTLDTLVGRDTVTAAVSGAAPVQFEAVSTPDVAVSLALDAGGGQADTVLATLPVDPTVVTRDQYGNVVPGVSVSFAVTQGGGTPGAPSDVTDADGLASVSWTLGSAPGSNVLTATSAGLTGSPLDITATATAGAPSQIAITEGDGQTATVGNDVPLDPAVRIEDASGNPVAT
jgi:hypothetical protein